MKFFRTDTDWLEKYIALLLALGMLLYLINLPILINELTVISLIIILIVCTLSTILFIIKKPRFNLGEVIKFLLLYSSNKYLLVIFSIIVTLLTYILPYFELPWQWELYGLFMTLYCINIPEKISKRSDEKFNLLICVAFSFIIILELRLMEKTTYLFINLPLSLDATIIDFLFKFLILIALFVLGYIFLPKLIWILLSTKYPVSEDKYSLSSGIQNIFLLTSFSVFAGDYIFYPTLLLLIFLDDKLFDYNLLKALNKAEEKIYDNPHASKNDIFMGVSFYSL